MVAHKYRVFWANRPPPHDLSPGQLSFLVPVDFHSQEAALRAAALILRAGQHVWCIERPAHPPMYAAEVKHHLAARSTRADERSP